MFKIVTDGATLAMTEAPTYIKRQENGIFVLCPEAEAQGIAYAGTPYHLLGRPEMEGAVATVMLEETDTGEAIGEAKTMAASAASMCSPLTVAAQQYAKTATDIEDADALQMADLFQTWEAALKKGEKIACGVIINDGGTLYRVVPPDGVTPLESQPPHGAGMLAVYRPIDTAHAGTLEDPIPWVYGMDCKAGLFYEYGGKVYACKGDMIPCVWAPTTDIWQWEPADQTENAEE